LGTGLCSIWWFLKKVIDPFILRGHNFFNPIPFLTIFGAINAPIGGVQVLFRHQKKWSPFFNLAYLGCLNVIIATQLQLMNN
jgi:hypothetical protein